MEKQTKQSRFGAALQACCSKLCNIVLYCVIMSEHQRAAVALEASRLNSADKLFVSCDEIFMKLNVFVLKQQQRSHVVDGCVSAQVSFSLLCSSFDLSAGKQKGIKEQLHNCKL